MPIQKNDSKLEMSSYKPISVLSNIVKIFEKPARSTFTEFLE